MAPIVPCRRPLGAIHRASRNASTTVVRVLGHFLARDEQRLRFSRRSNIFFLGALAYSLDEGKMSGRVEAFTLLTFSALLHFRAGRWGLPLRSALSCAFAVGAVFLLGCPVWAEADLLMRAVGLALTGTNDAQPTVIDRASCVFAIKNELFRLNNVYSDRIKIQGWQKQWLGSLEQTVTVELHGDGIVFEETVEPPNDDGSELMRQMRLQSPNIFEPHHYAYTRHELYLSTKDQDGVKRAWQYVYSHGCTGKRAP
jgi:hypothetical protein